MKKYLIVTRKSPIEDLDTEEILELALSLASLDHYVSLLLLDDAGLLLLDSNFDIINRNLLSKTIDAFKLFNFENIYVENIMLDNFQSANLSVLPEYKNNIKSFYWEELNVLYKAYDIVLNF